MGKEDGRGEGVDNWAGWGVWFLAVVRDGARLVIPEMSGDILVEGAFPKDPIVRFGTSSPGMVNQV